MKTLVLLFALVASIQCFAGTATWKTLEITLSHDVLTFTKDIGRYCLSTPKSRIEPSGTTLKVIDSPACSAEMKKIAEAWDKASAPVAAANTMRKSKTAIEEQVVQKFGKLPNHNVALLIETDQCPCMVFSGAKAQEAAEIARSAKRMIPTQPLDLLDGKVHDLSAPQGQ